MASRNQHGAYYASSRLNIEANLRKYIWQEPLGERAVEDEKKKRRNGNGGKNGVKEKEGRGGGGECRGGKANGTVSGTAIFLLFDFRHYRK